MARTRQLKPQFFTDDDLGTAEPLARLCFAGLWTLADREGRLLNRPRQIKVQVLPYDDCDIEKILDELEARKFIVRYTADGVSIIQIRSFKKNQTPHPREAERTLPQPQVMVEPRLDQGMAKDMTSQACINTNSIIPSTLPPEASAASPPPASGQPSKASLDSIELPPELNTPEFVAAWQTWLKVRSEIRKPLKVHGAQACLKKLLGWANDGGVALAIESLDNSSAGGWQGLFDPRERRGGSANGKALGGIDPRALE